MGLLLLLQCEGPLGVPIINLICVLWLCSSVPRMGRTTSHWQQVRERDLPWLLTPGAPTADLRMGRLWRLSCTMTTRRPSGQHDVSTCHCYYHLCIYWNRSGRQWVNIYHRLLMYSVVNVHSLSSLCADCPSRVRGAAGPSVWRHLKTSLWRTAVSWWDLIARTVRPIHKYHSLELDFVGFRHIF